MTLEKMFGPPFSAQLKAIKSEIAIISELELIGGTSGIEEIGQAGSVGLWRVKDSKAVGLTIPPKSDIIFWRDIVRAAIDFGAQRFIFITTARRTPYSNAADGIVVTDHINLSGRNPLVGRNDEHYGPRFPDVTAMYDKEAIGSICKKAQEFGLNLKPGLALAPLNPEQLNVLEQKVLEQNSVAAICGGVFSAAITAAHAGKIASAILFFTIPASNRFTRFLAALPNLFSTR